jgi:hypothetical protein
LVVLTVSVVGSAIGNVRHAELVASAHWVTVARWIGGSLPVALLVMVEGIELAILAGASKRARKAGMYIVVPLAAVVLASSYAGLLNIVTESGLFRGGPRIGGTVTVTDLLNYGLAAVPDFLMLASTIYLISLRRQGAEHTAVVRDHHRGTAVVDAATGVLTAALGKWTRKLEVPVGGSVGVATGGSVGGSVGGPVGGATEGAESATGGAVEGFVGGLSTPVGGNEEVAGRADIGGLAAGSNGGLAGGVWAPESAHVGGSTGGNGAPARIPVGGDPYRAAARWMRQTGDVRKSERDIAKVIAALEDGLTHNAIKTRLGVSSGTTSTIADGWRQWQSRDRQLTPVG